MDQYRDQNNCDDKRTWSGCPHDPSALPHHRQTLAMHIVDLIRSSHRTPLANGVDERKTTVQPESEPGTANQESSQQGGEIQGRGVHRIGGANNNRDAKGHAKIPSPCCHLGSSRIFSNHKSAQRLFLGAESTIVRILYRFWLYVKSDEGAGPVPC